MSLKKAFLAANPKDGQQMLDDAKERRMANEMTYIPKWGEFFMAKCECTTTKGISGRYLMCKSDLAERDEEFAHWDLLEDLYDIAPIADNAEWECAISRAIEVDVALAIRADRAKLMRSVQMRLKQLRKIRDARGTLIRDTIIQDCKIDALETTLADIQNTPIGDGHE